METVARGGAQRTTVLLIASFLTSCGPAKALPPSAVAAQVKDENDFALRKKFIGAAMSQVVEMEKGAALANPPPMIVPFGDWDFYYWTAPEMETKSGPNLQARAGSKGFRNRPGQYSATVLDCSSA